LVPAVTSQLERQLTNKHDLFLHCVRTDTPCAETATPRSLEEAERFAQRMGFPIVVKAAETYRVPRGARSVTVVRTRDELVSSFQRLSLTGEPNVIVQEYLPPESAEDWVAHGYVNPNSGSAVYFTGIKLRSYPAFAGPTTLGLAVPNEALASQTARLLTAIGYAGVFDLDYRLDRRSGKYKLLDFNPRVGANFRMFEDVSGIDVVRAMHLDMSGQVVRGGVERQRTFWVEPYDLLAAFGYLRARQLTLREWRESLRGVRESAWLQHDDMLPFCVMCARLLLRGAKRTVEDARGRRLQSLNIADRPAKSPIFAPLKRAPSDAELVANSHLPSEGR
jgi:predicted ATP-grasp superfamily ATP-dependent carboligase